MGLFSRSRRPRAGGNPNRVSKGSLVAAGYRVKREQAEQQQRLAQPWQSRAFFYYDELGCIKYAAQFYARMLAPLRLYAAKRDDNGDWVEIEPGADGKGKGRPTGDDALALAALERIQDPGGGGREDLQAAYGRLLFISGEAQLFCSLDKDTRQEQWEMLSRDELKVNGTTYSRVKAPSMNPEEYKEPADDDYTEIDDETAVVYRLWRKHPRFSDWPDSSMRGVLDDCEELLLLSRAVRSRTRSRLASAGLLAISEEFNYSPLEPVPDEDPEEDPFLADLTAAMMSAIEDEGSASASVPIVVRGPTDAIKNGIRHVQIVDPTQLYPETGLRYELIQRIAIGLDMPAEALTGLGDLNHWTSWQIDEQTWKSHGMPVANQFVGDLNAAYYRPQLKADKVADPSLYAIRYDPAAVINHPDKTKDAKDLHDKLVVSDEYLREAAGVDEDAAPDREELVRRIGQLVKDGSLATTGVPRALDSPGGTTGQGTPSVDAPVDIEGATGANDVVEGPPAAVPGDSEPITAAATNGHDAAKAIAVARMLGAVDLALLRAREVAGNRILSLAKKDPEALALIEEAGGRARDAAAILGVERVRALGGGDARLLVAPATALLLDSLRLWRIDEKAVELVVAQVERHAARTLYDLHPSPLPPQLEGYLDGVVPAS